MQIDIDMGVGVGFDGKIVGDGYLLDMEWAPISFYFRNHDQIKIWFLVLDRLLRLEIFVYFFFLLLAFTDMMNKLWVILNLLIEI
jgi:hypothetical protein